MSEDSNIIHLSQNISYIPSLKRLYIGHFHPTFYPFLILFIFQAIFFSFVFLLLKPYIPNSYNSNIEINLSIIFNFIFLLILLISTYEGPGYLPFDYFISRDDTQHLSNSIGIAISDNDCNDVNSFLNCNINFNYSPSPFIIYQEPQYISRNTPKCVNFIPSERRFILSPIVYDILTGTWIGQRNVKLFIQAKFYSILSSLFLIRPYFASLHYFIRDYSLGYDFAFSISVFTFFIVKLSLQCIICLLVINKMAFSTIRFHEETEISNLRDAYHNLKSYLGSNPISWLSPIPTFYKLSNEEVYQLAKMNNLIF